MKRKRINIGSISHGTMRAEDLIPAFIDELESQKPLHRAHRKLITSIQKNIARYEDNPPENVESDGSYWDSEDASYDLESLFDALGEYCAPYFYFGAHPGDGSDYGYWLSESFQDDFDGLVKSTNGFKDTYSQDGVQLDGMPKGYTGELLSISDHGNLTLYSCFRGRMREIWSIV